MDQGKRLAAERGAVEFEDGPKLPGGCCRFRDLPFDN